MNPPQLMIRLIDESRIYQPGDVITAEYRASSLRLVSARAVEASVLWHTEGKGDEDMAVHFFQRLANDDEALDDLRRPRRFSTVLPNSPLSYEGAIVKVRWCVRVRAFLDRGKELVAEETFRLGHVPRPQLPMASEPGAVLQRAAAAAPADDEQ